MLEKECLANRQLCVSVITSWDACSPSVQTMSQYSHMKDSNIQITRIILQLLPTASTYFIYLLYKNTFSFLKFGR